MIWNDVRNFYFDFVTVSFVEYSTAQWYGKHNNQRESEEKREEISEGDQGHSPDPECPRGHRPERDKAAYFGHQKHSHFCDWKLTN